ncbi:MAG: TraB/GumN family protein [Bacteroidetes bacterium]|nr:TraB/GumN family protein [Bacteroidota bacterium]MBS1650097.1 TraB/GumN family protein [Bacteroidota bacterium]
MKRFIILLFAFVLIKNITAQQPPTEKTLLWKISGKEIKQPSYIYGTFHLLCPNDFILPDTLVALLHTTKHVYFELKLDDPTLNMKMMQSIMMQNEHDLKEYITKENYDSIAAIFLHKTKLPLTAVSKYKPFILSSLLYPSMLGCTPISCETEIMKIAKKDSLPINGLETVDFQLKVFDEIPYNVQAKMLEKNLLNFNKSVAELKELISIYKTKDITKMQKEVADEPEFGKYENVLLKKRNTNWVPIIINQITNSSTFFAVGAGHLGGKNGILNLLQEAGYTLTPILY